MIRCKPKGICSWDFFLDGEGPTASLDFNWLGEQGAIEVDGTPFEVCKHGMLSGRWTLDYEGEPVVTAQKSTAFTRSFEIQDLHGRLTLRAESPFGRSFRLERSGELIASISPVHAFTRRATIETLAKNCEFTTISFCFWLVVLTWRRAAQSNSS